MIYKKATGYECLQYGIKQASSGLRFGNLTTSHPQTVEI